jgi:hypothetical protein
MATRATPLPTKKICPCEVRSIGSASRTNRIGAITWVSNCVCSSASVCAASGPTATCPALLTSTSRRPKRSRASATICAALAGSVMSSAAVTTRPYSVPICSARVSSAVRLRPIATTSYPVRAARIASARPIPDDAPVMTMTLIGRSCGLRTSCAYRYPATRERSSTKRAYASVVDASSRS